MSEPSVLVASAAAYGLGEGPLWDAERERVLWVDINAGAVHAARLGNGVLEDVTTLVQVDETVSVVVCDAAGRLLVAGTRSVFATEARPGLATDEPARRTPLVPASKHSRLNDGACDPAGRFLVGSMALDDRQGEECLYRIEHDGTVTTIDDDLTISNGLGWSPDGSVLYSVDTTPGIVYERPYDPASGAGGERAIALRIDDGSPDGLCVDADGNLWIAIWGAGQVRCYSPAGEHLRTVAVPAPHTSCPAFVGPALDTLLISTANEDEPAPAGHLFTARVGVRGLPTTPWQPG